MLFLWCCRWDTKVDLHTQQVSNFSISSNKRKLNTCLLKHTHMLIKFASRSRSRLLFDNQVANSGQIVKHSDQLVAWKCSLKAIKLPDACPIIECWRIGSSVQPKQRRKEQKAIRFICYFWFVGWQQKLQLLRETWNVVFYISLFRFT